MKPSRIEVVCLDVNDTLVKEKTWPDLNFAMGMTPEENTKYYLQHKRKEITYTEWVEIALKIYRERKNLKQAEILKIIRDYSYLPYAQELVAYLKQKYQVIIISCAMDLLVKKVAQELNVENYKSLTKFFFNEQGYIAKIEVDDRAKDEALNKIHFLEEQCEIMGVDSQNCVCIDDGSNGYELFKKFKGITFKNSKREHQALAWKVVNSLEEVKYIL